MSQRERIEPEAWAPRRGTQSVLLVVPKRRELDAATVVFDLEQSHEGRFRTHMRFRQKEIEFLKLTQGGVLTVVCLEEAGNLPAANAVRDYQDAFGRPDLAILSGTAMGIFELPGHDGREHARAPLGDVVIADKVYDYDPRRVLPDRIATRFETYRIQRALFYDTAHHASNLVGFYDLLEQCVAKLGVTHELPPGFPADWHPQAHVRGILAGDELVEDGSGPQRGALQDRIAALEMEGAGFAGTCDHIGVPWLVSRGISDFGTPDRDKRWQVYAAAAAMTFVRTFLENEFIPSGPLDEALYPEL